MSKSQTATEYLIILAVVIAIAIIVIGALGGIPGISGGAKQGASDAALKSGKIGITNYAIFPNIIKMGITNNNPNTISLINLSLDNTDCSFSGATQLNPGTTKTINANCPNLNFTSGETYSLPVSIYFKDIESGAIYLENNTEFSIAGTVALSNATGSGSGASCSLDGATILSGSGATFYLTSSVPFGSSCSGISRSCIDGLLSGNTNYNKASCTVQENTFVSSWKTDNTGTSNDDQITLPLEAGGTYNFIVYWGDGTNDTITAHDDAEVTHTYSSSGTYQVNITGTLSGFRFNNGGDRQKIINISRWGPLHLGNNGSYFYGCDKLDMGASDAPNLTGTTNLENMFRTPNSFDTKYSGDFSNWDVSEVTNMGYLFNSRNFNENIGNWDVGNVQNMRYMFYISPFNQDIGSWNVSNVTNMIGMFEYSDINYSLSNWDTRNLRYADRIFKHSDFNNNISTWNLKNLISMQQIFESTPFNQDISKWNISNATSIARAFADSAFNGNISHWNTSKVTNMNGLFYDSSFNQSIGNWNTSSLEQAIQVFAYNSAFNQDIGNWNVSKVQNMQEMFERATNFNQDISGWNVGSVTNMQEMFYFAENFNWDLSGWDVDQVTSWSSCYGGAWAWTEPKPNFT